MTGADQPEKQTDVTPPVETTVFIPKEQEVGIGGGQTTAASIDPGDSVEQRSSS
jgi:hypothetical protein